MDREGASPAEASASSPAAETSVGVGPELGEEVATGIGTASGPLVDAGVKAAFEVEAADPVEVADPVGAPVVEDGVVEGGDAPDRGVGRAWRSIVFAPRGDGQRRRRGSDAVRVMVAVLASLVGLLAIRAGSHPEHEIANALNSPPEGVAWLVSSVWYVGSLGVIVGVSLLALVSRRRQLAKDAALAGLGTWALCIISGLVLGSSGGRPPDPSLNGISTTFPLTALAVTVAVATAALPYLNRALRRTVEGAVAVGALAAVVGGSGLPVNVLVSIAIGWGVTAVIHLILGSPLGLPSAGEVVDMAADIGLNLAGLEPVHDQQWGVALFRGRDEDGPVDVSVYGRDAADAQLLGKTWRFLFYRDSGPTLTVTRLQQVEHEAYLMLLSERSGVRTPEIVEAAGPSPGHDAMLVTRPPPGRPLAESGAEATDSNLDAIFLLVGALRSAEIAHGALSAASIIVDDTGGAGVTDFRFASSSAPVERLDRDLAGTLAVVAAQVGAERAVAAAERTIGIEAVTRALPHLRRASLDPAAARELRGKRQVLTDLRTAGADIAGVDAPKLAEPRRVSWPTFILAIGTVIGGWALIGVLVSVGESFDTLRGADWAWVVAVFILSQLAYPSEAVSVIGSVVQAVPFGRATALEVSNCFTSLAGGSIAVLAARVRFFQQQGYPATIAVSSGALASTASWIVKGGLFLVSLPFALGDFHFDETPTGGDNSHAVQLIMLFVIAIGVALGAVLLVPRLRHLARDTLRPKLVDVIDNLKLLARRPRKLVEVFAGATASQLFVVLALGASLHAFDVHLSLPILIVVITLGASLGGVSPVPGGMGVVEAGMIIGLTAAGVDQDVAVAAVFVQRLFTAYLPPVWGWFTLVWMRRREYL